MYVLLTVPVEGLYLGRDRVVEGVSETERVLDAADDVCCLVGDVDICAAVYLHVHSENENKSTIKFSKKVFCRHRQNQGTSPHVASPANVKFVSTEPRKRILNATTEHF